MEFGKESYSAQTKKKKKIQKAIELLGRGKLSFQH